MFALRLALVGLSLLLPLLLLEALLRVAGPVLPGEYQTATFFVADAELGRRARPNTAGWVRTAEYVTWVRVNSHGLRGPEVAYPRPADSRRVLVLGDSFTFALQVPEEQTFVARLAGVLNESAVGARVETINAGSDGWSTISEYTWLATEGYRYQPDLVLLMFFAGNDPGDNANEAKAAQRFRRGLGLAGESAGPLNGLRETLRDNSAAFNAFEHGVLAKVSFNSDETAPRVDDEADDETKPAGQKKSSGWDASETWLERLRDFCAANRQKLVIVGIPADYQVAASRPTSLPLREISERLGVPYIELLESFQAQSKSQRERLYLKQNRHWTAAGHALAAEYVANQLLQRRLLPALDLER